MDVFSWFLVISLSGTDELLVKEMPSKNACISMKKEFMKKFKGKLHDIDYVDCEEGMVTESFKANDEEVL